MSYIPIVFFTVECFLLLAWGLMQQRRMYEFPFLAAAVFTGFILPQLIGLFNDPFISFESLNKTIFMSGLCLGMSYVGYRKNTYPLKSFNWVYSEKRLLYVSIFFSIIGAYFFIAIRRLPEELTSVSNWSGPPVLYLFFANVIDYAFAISLLLFLKTRNKFALWIVIFDIMFYFDRIFIAARRGIILQIFLYVMLSIWFSRKAAVSRGIMVIGIICATLFIYSVGEYRGIGGSRLKEISQIEFLNNLKEILKGGGVEMRNAVVTIESVDATKNFDFGIFHWNTFVFNYVPAQIVGSKIKESLMIPVRDPAYTLFLYTAPTGSTFTGMSDAFRSFWYFGALKFFLIGLILSKLYRSAIKGNIASQLFYMLTITPALQSITHHTQWFFSAWVHIGIFLIPALLFARRKRNNTNIKTDKS